MSKYPIKQSSKEELRVIINGFKSIYHIDLTLKPLTIFIGPPASGKSNVLEALAITGYFLYKLSEKQEYVNAKVPPLAKFIRASSTRDLFHFYDIGKNIWIRLEDKELTINYKTDDIIAINMRDVRVKLKTSLSAFSLLTETMPSGTAFLRYPIRLYCYERFNVLSNIVNPKGLAPKNYLSEDASNIHVVLQSYRKTIKDMNMLMKEYDVNVELKVLRDGKVIVFDSDYELGINALSDGIFRLLYYLLAIETNKEYSMKAQVSRVILLFDEPTSNIYPYGLDLLVKYLKNALGRLWYVISTHNPYLLSIIGDKIKDAAIYFTYRDEYGNTKVVEIDVNKMAEQLVSSDELLILTPKEIFRRKLVKEH